MFLYCLLLADVPPIMVQPEVYVDEAFKTFRDIINYFRSFSGVLYFRQCNKQFNTEENNGNHREQLQYPCCNRTKRCRSPASTCYRYDVDQKDEYVTPLVKSVLRDSLNGIYTACGRCTCQHSILRTSSWAFTAHGSIPKCVNICNYAFCCTDMCTSNPWPTPVAPFTNMV